MYFKLLRFVLCKVYLNKAVKMKNEKNKVKKCFCPPGPYILQQCCPTKLPAKIEMFSIFTVQYCSH